MITKKHIQLLAPVLLLATCAISIPGRAQTIQTNAPPPPKWESVLAAGFTLTRGNSETMLASFTAATRKKWNDNELSFGADGTYGQSTVNESKTNKTTITTANSAKGIAQYNRLFTERFFGYLRADGMFDDVADIYYRVTVSPGVGYYFIKNTNTDLCLEVGPGYLWENVAGVEDDYATLRVGEKFHTALSDRARLTQTAEWQPEVEDFNNYIATFMIGVEADLTADKKFTLGVFLYDSYVNFPAPGRKCNDIKLVTAIGYKF